MKSSLKSIIIISSCLLVSACHDNSPNGPDTPDQPVEDKAIPEIDGKIYNAENISLNSETYLNEIGRVPYDITLAEGQHAVLCYDGDNYGVLKLYTDNLDLSTIEGNPVSGVVARPSLAGFGKEVSIPLNITPDYIKKRYLFHGNHEVAGISITIKGGEATSEDLSSYFSEFFVDDEIYSGGFKYEGAYCMTDVPERNADYHYAVSPFVVGLESTAYPEDKEKIISLSDAMQVLLTTPLLKESDYGFDREIDNLISVSTLWGRLIPGFRLPTFQSYDPLSFNIFFIYRYEGTTYVRNIYPSNTFTASEVTESSYNLSIDPAKLFEIRILKNQTDNNKDSFALNTPALYSLMSNILLTLTPLNADGIRMEYINVFENGVHKFKSTFSDQTIGLEVLKCITSNVFNQAVVERLRDTLEDEGMDAKTLEAVLFVADNLQNILNNASGATFGWSYRYQDIDSYTDIDIRSSYYNKLYEN